MLIEGFIAAIAFAAGAAFSRRRMCAVFPSARALTAPTRPLLPSGPPMLDFSMPMPMPMLPPTLFEMTGLRASRGASVRRPHPSKVGIG